MEPKPRGIEPQSNQVNKSTEAELALHKLMGQVTMTISPKATVARLIENAANDVILTPEWEAFRDGALEVAEESSSETES